MNNAEVLTVAVRTNRSYYSTVYDDMGLLLNEPLFRYRARRNGWAFTPASLTDLEPRLAQRFDVSRDGRVYTIHLRHGIRSVAGNILTAADVKWSWDRAFQIRKQGRWTGRIAPMRSEDCVVARDDYVVEFHLDRPNVTFPHFLTSKYIPILDSREVQSHGTPDDPWSQQWLGSHQAGFGPFVVDSYDRKADVVVYSARDDYWVAGYPLIKQLVLRGVPSAADRIRLLEEKEVDVVTGLGPSDFVAIGERPDVQRLIIPSHDPVFLQMNCRKEPFANPNVRRAISYAVDYDAIRNEIWKGLVRPLKSAIVDACLGYTEEFFPYTTDRERARAILSAERIAVDRPIELLVDGEGSPEMLLTAESIRASLEEIGIRVQLRNVGDYEFRATAFQREFDLLLDGHTHVVPDPYYCTIDDYGDSKWGIQNFTGYSNENLYRLHSECLNARSEIERIQYVREFQRTILDDAPSAYLFLNNTLVAAHEYVDGLEWDVNGRMFFHNVSKRLS